MGSLSESIPATTKQLSSISKITGEAGRETQNPLKLMQHQEKPIQKLVPQINRIIAANLLGVEVLQEIARVVGETFEVDCCCLVALPGDDGEAITANWCAQKYLGMTQNDNFSAIDELDWPVMQCAEESFTIEDISTIERSLVVGCQYLPLPIKTVLGLPTHFGNNNNGVVILIHSQPYEWSGAEKKLLKLLEPLCAIAFAQLLQAQKIDFQKQSIEASSQYQNLLKKLTILSRSNLDLNQILQLAVASIAETLHADRGLLMLLKYTDPLFKRQRGQVPKAKVNLVGEWSIETSNICQNKTNLKESFSLADCALCQRVFTASIRPIIVNEDLEQQEGYNFSAAPIFRLSELPTVLLMPLESQGKILGFLVLQQSQNRQWKNRELNILEMICAQIVNIIIQSQTLRQVQNLVGERTAQLQRSLEVQAKLYEIKQQHVKQLQELNDLKDEFLSNMSDRLRYPLTNMWMAIRNLHNPGITPDRQTRYLEILEQECSKEINLINDLLTLQKLDSHSQPLQYETVDINIITKNFIASIQNQVAEKGLTISLDLQSNPLESQTEIESFKRILQELLNNAVKYSQHGSNINLKVTQRVEQLIDRVIIEVNNIGRAISKEEATYIFDRFRRGKGRWTPGTGLGLALAKSLVQHLNGSIKVESTPLSEGDNLSNICFTVMLPQFAEDNQPYSNSE
ncbi:two-component sensor histidine kinase [Richelia intracellularis HH01]|uniref:histidine kinase n=1 Tax=Richelia intracellularis HH01 TaxID=1165094 RepID=M1X589_9NOST|nr:GAF domain-containing sensor histidine kinase [Richelia intracellularis]CCH67171.1 two-component sensor histidine kinase [Richelia intracellularis HH01]HAE05294.1 ATPase [Richelia sp.]